MSNEKERNAWLWEQEMTNDIVEEIIKTNLGLINYQLKKFYMTYDKDAYSVALEALYKAVCTFDVKKEYKFATYATVCIYNGLGCYLRMLKNNETFSYDAIVNDGDSFLSMMQSNSTVEGRFSYSDRQAVTRIYGIINDEIKRLNKKPTHQLVLYTWVETQCKGTQEEIAKKAGCSQSYASRIIKGFVDKIKHKLLEV